MNHGPWPDPTPEMLESPEFEAIWQCIKRWDINVPDAYNGYCGATGNHVRAILDALPAAILAGRPMTGFLALLTDEQRTAALAYCGDDTHGALEPKAATGAFAEGTANEVDSNGLAVYINS